jgi:hypothetical protein
MDTTLRIEIVELEHEISSVGDRIKDIEWRIKNGEQIQGDDRTKAIDKKRYLKKELLKLKIKQCQKL